jgi:hypothetical protein
MQNTGKIHNLPENTASYGPAHRGKLILKKLKHERTCGGKLILKKLKHKIAHGVKPMLSSVERVLKHMARPTLNEPSGEVCCIVVTAQKIADIPTTGVPGLRYAVDGTSLRTLFLT